MSAQRRPRVGAKRSRNVQKPAQSNGSHHRTDIIDPVRRERCCARLSQSSDYVHRGLRSRRLRRQRGPAHRQQAQRTPGPEHHHREPRGRRRKYRRRRGSEGRARRLHATGDHDRSRHQRDPVEEQGLRRRRSGRGRYSRLGARDAFGQSVLAGQEPRRAAADRQDQADQLRKPRRRHLRAYRQRLPVPGTGQGGGRQRALSGRRAGRERAPRRACRCAGGGRDRLCRPAQGGFDSRHRCRVGAAAGAASRHSHLHRERLSHRCIDLGRHLRAGADRRGNPAEAEHGGERCAAGGLDAEPIGRPCRRSSGSATAPTPPTISAAMWRSGRR